MKPFILLLKIQLLGLFGINKTLHADPAKAKRTLALAALVVAAVVLFASAYSAGVAQGLVQIGLAEAVPLVAVLVGAIAGAVAAFLKTNGVLVGFKEVYKRQFYYRPVDGMPLDVLPSNALASSKKGR